MMFKTWTLTSTLPTLEVSGPMRPERPGTAGTAGTAGVAGAAIAASRVSRLIEFPLAIPWMELPFARALPEMSTTGVGRAITAAREAKAARNRKAIMFVMSVVLLKSVCGFGQETSEKVKVRWRKESTRESGQVDERPG